MAIIAGIDEAGFGPLLGPLVVSAAAFRVPDRQLNGCLWELLSDSCSRDVEKNTRRLPIADSKKLHRSREDLSLLERSVLVMLAAGGAMPKTWRELLDVLSPGATDALEAYPWYATADLTIPADDAADVPTRANALRRAMVEKSVELLGLYSEPLCEGNYNGLVQRTRNKSAALLGIVLRLVDRVFAGGNDDRVRVCVDRLGGRMHYRDSLILAFPAFDLQIVEESDDRSAYRLSQGSRYCFVEFVVSGEQKHFAVALASMISKYVRELYMRVFNEFWCRQHEGLAPTAGYYTDAQRWLKDAEPTIRRLAIKRDVLVRSR